MFGFDLKKIALPVAAAVLVFGVGMMFGPDRASAATCQFGTEAQFTANADVWTSTACVGPITGNDAIGNDSGANVNLNNPATFGGPLFGSTNWELDTRINVLEDKSTDPSTFSFASAAPSGILSATLGADALSGTWSVTSWAGIEKAMLILKGGNGFAAYLLDLTVGLNGEWITQALKNGGGQQPALSHVSLYTTPAPIPVPAAGLLLITALGGLGLAARRRRKAA